MGVKEEDGLKARVSKSTQMGFWGHCGCENPQLSAETPPAEDNVCVMTNQTYPSLGKWLSVPQSLVTTQGTNPPYTVNRPTS